MSTIGSYQAPLAWPCASAIESQTVADPVRQFKRAIVVTAHPDDESMAAGLVSKLSGAGAAVLVVVLTNGRCGASCNLAILYCSQHSWASECRKKWNTSGKSYAARGVAGRGVATRRCTVGCHVARFPGSTFMCPGAGAVGRVRVTPEPR